MEHAVWALVLALELESPRLLLARVATLEVKMIVVVADHTRVATLEVKMTVVVADHTRSPRLHLDPPRRPIDVF